MAENSERDWFITPPLSLALDLVRIAAALAVLAAHAAQLSVYQGPWPFSEMFQHGAVIVFFVLSGLVIAQATLSRPTTMRDYAIARVTRILPVAVPAALFGIAAIALAWSLGFDEFVRPVAVERLDGHGVPYPLLIIGQLSSGYGPAWNPPIWSLSYEIWFYALFGAAVFCPPERRKLALILLMLAAGPRILLLAPVWLGGVWLALHGTRWRLSSTQGAAAVTVGVLACVFLCQSAPALADGLSDATGIGLGRLRFSQYFLSDWAMTPAVALAFVGLRPLAEKVAPWLECNAGAIRMLAGASFTLYLMHWPLLSLLRMGGLACTSPLGGLALLGAIQLAALGIARFTEARRYTLRARVSRWFEVRSAIAT